jgi:hypothetical protein
MVKIGAVDIPIFQVLLTSLYPARHLTPLFQQTLATFAPQQNGVQTPSLSAVPTHLQSQSSRSGTPQFSTPPPGAFPIGAPRSGPAASGYPPQYIAGSGGHQLPTGHYSTPQPQQTASQPIPAALAAIPENQRVSSWFAFRRLTSNWVSRKSFLS